MPPAEVEEDASRLYCSCCKVFLIDFNICFVCLPAAVVLPTVLDCCARLLPLGVTFAEVVCVSEEAVLMFSFLAVADCKGCLADLGLAARFKGGI